MAITVLKNNVPWGPFTRAQIQEGLTRGDFTLRYLAHSPGLKEWLPLGEVLDHFDRGMPPLPSPERTFPPVPAEISLPPIPHERSFVVSSAPPPIPAEKPPPSAPPLMETPKTPRRPAPFFPRFIAFGIDCVVLFGPVFFLFGLGALTIQIQGMVEHNDSETMRQEWILLRQHLRQLLVLVALGGGWLYTAFLESSRWQATVGKHWIGLQVTDVQGERPSILRATGRHVAKCLSVLPCFLGFTMALFSSEGLSLHDRIAGTCVVKKEKR